MVKHRQADAKDHSIVVSCFSISFGLSNSVLSWFHSCLSSCTQTLSVSGSKSLPTVLQFGIPQCSFIVYTHPHSAVVSHHSVFPRSFSDGSRLHVSAHLSQLDVSAISVSFMSQPSQSALCLSHLSQLDVSAISVSFMSQPSQSAWCLSHLSQLYVLAISVSLMSQPSQSAWCLSHLSQLDVSAISVSPSRCSSSHAYISYVQALMHHNKLQLHTYKVEIILITLEHIHKSPTLLSSIQMNGVKHLCLPLSRT